MDERYSRQILFAPIGKSGQERLGGAHALLIGCGALGSVLAEMLVRAGLGRLTIADRDYVDESNLQRQSLFDEDDVREGLPKAVAARKRLERINSRVRIDDRVMDVTPRSIAGLVPGVGLILDGTDNFETRYLLNDAAWKWCIPWIYGACVGGYGISSAFIPGKTPCLRCILEQIPPPGSSPTCDTTGVIGPIVHLVAALQSAEALKILTGQPDQAGRRLITVDVWSQRFTSLDLSSLRSDGTCRACQLGRYEFLEGGLEGRARTLCGRNAVQISRGRPQPVDFVSIAERLSRLGAVRFNEHLLQAEVENFEIALFRDGRSIIRGTESEEEAGRIYAKYIGN